MTKRLSNPSLDVLIQLLLLVLSIAHMVVVRYFAIIVDLFNGLPLQPTKSILSLLAATYPALLLYQGVQLLFMVFYQKSKAHGRIFIGLLVLFIGLFLWTSAFQDFFRTSGFFNVVVLVLCAVAYLLFNLS